MYKRNQIEGAIARATGRTIRRGEEPRSDLLARIKRLIETDRALPLGLKGSATAYRHYAFFDGPPPGRGVEITYSAYAAFALFLAVRLMDAGLPQTEAVAFIRRIRTELEHEHRRIMRLDSKQLLDHKAPDGLEDEIARGSLLHRIDQMVFLAVLGGEGAQVTVSVDERGKASVANVVRGAKGITRILAHLASMPGGPIIVIELVNPIHQLALWLGRIEPTRRGRK